MFTVVANSSVETTQLLQVYHQHQFYPPSYMLLPCRSIRQEHPHSEWLQPQYRSHQYRRSTSWQGEMQGQCWLAGTGRQTLPNTINALVDFA